LIPPFALNLIPRRRKSRAVIILHKRVPNLTELALARFVTRARRAAGLKGAVEVLLTGNEEMKLLNQRFRGKNKATDVLSFPAAPKDLGKNDLRKQFAGSIAISAEIAAHNAQALGHTTAEEVKILVLHGILHLRRYDHERDKGQMARRERQLRAQLRLPVGLIERAGGERSRPSLVRPSFVRPSSATKNATKSTPSSKRASAKRVERKRSQ